MTQEAPKTLRLMTNGGAPFEMEIADIAAVCRDPQTGLWQIIPVGAATAKPNLFYFNDKDNGTTIVEVVAAREELAGFIEGAYQIPVRGKICSNFETETDRTNESDVENPDCYIRLSEVEEIHPPDTLFPDTNIVFHLTRFEFQTSRSISDIKRTVPAEYAEKINDAIILDDDDDDADIEIDLDDLDFHRDFKPN